MNRSIPSSDMVALCLIFADFDLDVSVAEVIRREKQYEETSVRYFGVGPGDFSLAFLLLAGDLTAELGREPPASHSLAAAQDLLARTTLRECIPGILRLNDHATKDTDSYWTTDEDFPKGSEWDYRLYNRPLREFFVAPALLSRSDVVDFLGSTGAGERLIEKHFVCR